MKTLEAGNAAKGRNLSREIARDFAQLGKPLQDPEGFRTEIIQRLSEGESLPYNGLIKDLSLNPQDILTDGAVSFVAADKSYLQTPNSGTANASLRPAEGKLYSFWFRLNNLVDSGAIIHFGYGELNTHFRLSYDAATEELIFQFATGAETLSPEYFITPITSGVWHNFVFWIEAGKYNYKFNNGTTVVSTENAHLSGMGASEANWGPLLLGVQLDNSQTPVNYLGGRIDSLFIFDSSTEAIRDLLWNAGNGLLPSETAHPNIISAWNFAEPSGLRYDSVGTNDFTEKFADVVSSSLRNGGFESVTYGANRATGDNYNQAGETVGNWYTAGTTTLNVVEDNDLGQFVLEADITTGGIILPSGYSLDAGKLYRVRFKHKSISGNTNLRLRNSSSGTWYDTEAFLDAYPISTSVWQTFETQMFHKGTGGNFYINISGAAGVFRFTDFEFQEITLPNWSFLMLNSSWFVSSDSYSGSNSLLLRHGGTDGGDYALANQNNSLTVGKKYSITARGKLGEGTGNFRLEIVIGGLSYALTRDVWHELEPYEGITTSGGFRLSRTIGAGTETYYDNVTVRAASIISGVGIKSGVASNGETVSEWGSLAQVTAAKRPVKTEEGIYFDGVDDFLMREALPDLSNDKPWTVCIHFNLSNSSNGLLHNRISATNEVNFSTVSNFVRVSVRDADGVIGSSISRPISLDTDYLLIVSWDGVDASTGTINGLPLDGVGNSIGAAHDGLFIGSRRNDIGDLAATYYHLSIFNRVLTGFEIETIERFIND